ncbi:hypothetical protein N7532_011658 [Penicillium argentinense]|uniref:RNA-binding La domain protein n=1 Tax=Penicillium argentinense TaxID=1131581 RepID=A0A9W9EJ11_9EURO|nr:uncharacterized protein N7532_011658 [Penicillium argentinense]KAJ5082615.1 hypothetical protein N7532_011658 [Penicillium argentinense]
MSDEQKPTNNAQAEQDVKDVLSELKGEDAVPAEASKEDAEEARIVAEAAKLGEKSETQEKSEQRDSRGYRPRATGSKFDPSQQKETDDPVQIRKQVEFYFSDSNLPMDKFLFTKVGGSENHPVPLELLHSFKRMRRFQPFSAIVEALKTSETLELTDDNTAVKRKVPLSQDVKVHSQDLQKVYEDKAMARSIYAKGFCGFGEEEATTQLDIEAFFEPYGPVKSVRLRRSVPDKIFKGSVFVEFESEEKQKAFLALDPKPKFHDRELLIKSKKEYCDEKVADINSGKVQANGERFRGGNRGGRGGRGGRGRGRGGAPRNDRDWRERRDEDKKNGFKANKDSRGVPVVKSTADDSESAGQKRARDEEASNDHPAKKVDSKE